MKIIIELDPASGQDLTVYRALTAVIEGAGSKETVSEDSAELWTVDDIAKFLGKSRNNLYTSQRRYLPPESKAVNYGAKRNLRWTKADVFEHLSTVGKKETTNNEV